MEYLGVNVKNVDWCVDVSSLDTPKVSLQSV